MLNLLPQKALIFRITHRKNLPWIVEHGLHCASSGTRDPNFISIGNPDLIDKRRTRVVPQEPAGMLSDYVPFYFTPRSPMLLNIKTGYNGIRQRKNEDIVILGSSLPKLLSIDVPFVFTDRHAFLTTACFSSDLDEIDMVDWHILRASDFARDNNDLGKVERYQAEALAYRHVPIEGILGVACCNDHVKAELESLLEGTQLAGKIITKPRWYF
jgi:hypothetical protein